MTRLIMAAAAIKKLREKAYCLIVTDFRLPDKQGTTVIKAARLFKINQTTPLILVSAQISENDFETYLTLGANGVLIKPYSLEVLKATIQCLTKS